MNVQNTISLVLTAEQLSAMEAAVRVLETTVPGLISLTAEQKRVMTKMGERSETFCRQTLSVLKENPQMLPPNIDVADAAADLKTSDELRPLLVRLTQVFQRLQDTDFALRSDVMALSLRGYQLLKVNGRGAGLETLQRDLSNRFGKKRRSGAEAKAQEK